MVIIALCIGLWSFIPREKSSDPEKDKMLIELLTFVIEKGHYSPADIDDAFSKGVCKDYLNALDPSKRFFLQSDMDEFAKYETQIDDQIKSKDLTFFDLKSINEINTKPFTLWNFNAICTISVCQYP